MEYFVHALYYLRQTLCPDSLKRKPSESISARCHVSFRTSRISLLSIWYDFVVNTPERLVVDHERGKGNSVWIGIDDSV